MSFSYNPVSNLTPLHFCFNQRSIANVDTSRPNYTCMHTHLFTDWQISLFVISRYAEISFPFNQSYIQCFQKFTKSAQCSSFKKDYYGNGVGLHLVVCPHVCMCTACQYWPNLACFLHPQGHVRQKWLKITTPTTFCLTRVIALQIHHSTEPTSMPVLLYSSHIRIFFQNLKWHNC